MYPAQFEYQQAESVPEALDALSNNPEAELIAGGHSLLPTMKSGLADPEMLVDIGEIDDLHGIEHRDGSTRIGAMTSYADVADDDTLREEATIFAETAGEIGDVQVRNRGTVGGNIAHADPASDLPGAVLASTVRSPSGPATCIVASAARTAPGRSDAGSAWAMLPPTVPRLRTWKSPIWCAVSANTSASSRSVSSSATSA